MITKFSSEGVTTKIDYDGGTNAIYIGEALPGTLTSNSKWRIKKLTYDGNNNVTDIKCANGEALSFTVEFDDRTTYTYS